MRLDADAVAAIRRIAREIAGAEAGIRLFGSRVDDFARGGDVDLLLELSQPVEQPAQLAAQISARISRALGGRHVDVLIAAPNLQRLPVHDQAVLNGVPL